MTITNRKLQKMMTQPINAIFSHLQKRNRVSVWLFENTSFRIEGYIIGFDEFMNLVLDQAEEVYEKKGAKKNAPDSSADESSSAAAGAGKTVVRRPIGKILLKGDNVCLICNIGQ